MSDGVLICEDISNEHTGKTRLSSSFVHPCPSFCCSPTLMPTSASESSRLTTSFVGNTRKMMSGFRSVNVFILHISQRLAKMVETVTVRLFALSVPKSETMLDSSLNALVNLGESLLQTSVGLSPVDVLMNKVCPKADSALANLWLSAPAVTPSSSAALRIEV